MSVTSVVIAQVHQIAISMTRDSAARSQDTELIRLREINASATT